MCRRMIEAGHDPSTRLEVYRGAILALTVRSIGEGSQLTVKSASNGTPVLSRKPKGIVPQPRPCAKRAGPPHPWCVTKTSLSARPHEAETVLAWLEQREKLNNSRRRACCSGLVVCRALGIGPPVDRWWPRARVGR